MVLKYTNYDNLDIKEELLKIEKSRRADIVLEPKNKDCLFVLGMLFANGIKIKILNEKDLDLTPADKSMSLMTYVWSRISDNKFPNKDYSNVLNDVDNRVENLKRTGKISVEKIKNKPKKNKIFLICPVRNATAEQKAWIENFVSEKTKAGYEIHAPHLHTRQKDIFWGYAICKQNANAVATSSEVDIYYDQKSEGSIFDLGVAYALHKPLKILNKKEIKFNKKDSIDKIVMDWSKNESLNGDLQDNKPQKEEKKVEKEPIKIELPNKDIMDLKKMLLSSWTSETCAPGLREFYSKNNPSLGQCAITSLVVNDLFGGKIMRCMASSGSHYYNLIDGKIVDLTVEQFLGEVPRYEAGEERTREYLLGNEDTKNRYLKLMYNLRQVMRMNQGKKFVLTDGNGKLYYSDVPGTLGGNRKLKIYGRLDCPSALRWVEKGMYAHNRVFFANEEDAISAGYRPCAVCMKKEYEEWKSKNAEMSLRRK